MYKLILLFFLLNLSGCGEALSGSVQPISDVDSEKHSPLKAEFLIKNQHGQEVKSITLGEELTLQIRVSNLSALAVLYRVTGPGHDFFIKKSGELVWSKFHGMMFAQVISERTIAAHEILLLEAKWSGMDNQGKQVSPGEYEVEPRIVLFFNDKRLAAPSAQVITVQ